MKSKILSSLILILFLFSLLSGCTLEQSEEDPMHVYLSGVGSDNVSIVVNQYTTNITESTTSNLTGIVTVDGSSVSTIAQPSGTVVGTTDTQSLSNKTIANLLLTGYAYLNDSSNTKQTYGLTLHQSTNSDEILSLKASHVAHNITDITESDTYGFFKKGSSTQGSLLISGLGEGSYGILNQGYSTNQNTDNTSSAHSPVHMVAGVKSGSSVTSLDAGSNIFTVQNYNSTELILKGNGDLWIGGGVFGDSGYTEYDIYDDAILLRDSISLNDYQLLVDAGIAQVKYKYQERTKPDDPLVLERDSKGEPIIVGYTFDLVKLIKLAAGGVYQNREKIDSLTERIESLESQFK